MANASLPLYRVAFPALTDTNHRETSKADPTYNCIGHAAETTQWWEPVKVIGGNVYWPPSAPFEPTVNAYTKAYESIGYEQCANGDNEEGYLKVAIFVKNGVPQHAARQISETEWTSKLGQALDIAHPLKAVEGAIYGQASVFLRKAK